MTPKTADIYFLCYKCYSSFVTSVWWFSLWWAMWGWCTSNRLQPSSIWRLFLTVKEPSKIGSFLTSFTRHGSLRFQRKRGKLRPHAAGCQKYLITALCSFLVTNLTRLTYRLLHDSDLFTLQSIQCIPAWSLTRRSTSVTQDPLKVCLWEKFVHTCWGLTQN